MAKVSDEYVEKSFHKRFVKMSEPERLGVLKVLNTLNEALSESSDEADDAPAETAKRGPKAVSEASQPKTTAG